MYVYFLNIIFQNCWWKFKTLFSSTPTIEISFGNLETSQKPGVAFERFQFFEWSRCGGAYPKNQLHWWRKRKSNSCSISGRGSNGRSWTLHYQHYSKYTSRHDETRFGLVRLFFKMQHFDFTIFFTTSSTLDHQVLPPYKSRKFFQSPI